VGKQKHQGMLDSNKTEYAVSEAMKTIEKLNAMVSRQETLLEAYTQDNQKLWTQLKDAKVRVACFYKNKLSNIYGINY